MKVDLAKVIYNRVKLLPNDKQQEILRHIDSLDSENSVSIWQKFRARAKYVPEKVWNEMPKDGSEQHDPFLKNDIDSSAKSH